MELTTALNPCLSLPRPLHTSPRHHDYTINSRPYQTASPVPLTPAPSRASRKTPARHPSDHNLPPTLARTLSRVHQLPPPARSYTNGAPSHPHRELRSLRSADPRSPLRLPRPPCPALWESGGRRGGRSIATQSAPSRWSWVYSLYWKLCYRYNLKYMCLYTGSSQYTDRTVRTLAPPSSSSNNNNTHKLPC